MPRRPRDSLDALFLGFWTGALVVAGAGAVICLATVAPGWIGVALDAACGCLGLAGVAILRRTARAWPPDLQLAHWAGAMAGVVGATIYGFVEVVPKVVG